jgi:hypothetical protein
VRAHTAIRKMKYKERQLMKYDLRLNIMGNVKVMKKSRKSKNMSKKRMLRFFPVIF